MNDPVTEVVVLGAGGHARVLIDLLRQVGTPTPVAILDQDRSLVGVDLLGVPIVGDDDALERFDPTRTALVNGVGSVRDTARRQAVFLRGRDRGFRFATLVHPTAVLAEGLDLGEGVLVLAGAVVNTGVRVGEDTILNTATVIEHDCTIGSHVHVASGAILAGGVTVEDGAHIGAGATVIQGVRIGLGAVIGAGAVVIDDIGADVVAVGVPARPRGDAR